MTFPRIQLDKTSFPLVLAIMLLSSNTSQSLDYGTYDTRSLAMGGATVAAATPQHAHFYNPALLATLDVREEESRNGRVVLPAIIVAEITDNVDDLIDILDDELDEDLENAVEAFNADANVDNAAAIANASRNLQTALNNLGNEDFNGEAYLGLSVSEPSDRSGGAFYFGARVIASGSSEISNADLELLGDYIDAMDFIVSGGAEGEANPELFVDGQLRSPEELLTSSGDVSSLVFTEWGVALSKEFDWLRQEFAFGITPKVMLVDIYRDTLDYANTDFNYEEDKRSHFNLNADIGMAVTIAENYRIGLAAKDIIPQAYEAGTGQKVETSVRSRMGLAYLNDYLTLGLDYDLQENEPLGNEAASQDLALGLELRPWSWVDLRIGYTQDLAGDTGDTLSGGVQFTVWRFVAEVAYAKSDISRAGGLQLGWTF